MKWLLVATFPGTRELQQQKTHNVPLVKALKDTPHTHEHSNLPHTLAMPKFLSIVANANDLVRVAPLQSVRREGCWFCCLM